MISRFKIVIRVSSAFIRVCSRAFTIFVSLITLISFFFNCNMSSIERFDCEVEKFRLSLKSDHRIWLDDDENDISFDVKSFIVEKLFADRTEIFFDKTKLSRKWLSLLKKKTKNANVFFLKSVKLAWIVKSKKFQQTNVETTKK